MNENILQKKAMVVNFTAKQYTGRKKDKAAAQTVLKEYGNEKGTGNYIKQSIAKEHLAAIVKNINEFRTFLYTHTLPWTHKGDLLLSTDLYQKVMEKERELSTKHDELVTDFLKNYQDYINDARSKLNGLFNPLDYPAPSKIESKFSWSINFAPVPAGQNFKVELAQSDIDTITQDIENRNQDAIKQANQELWNRIYSAVKALSEKMKESRQVKGEDVTPIFRDSIIGNIKELVELLPGLNILNDPALETARQDLEKDLGGIEPNELRKSSGSRQEVAEKADAILNNIQGIF